MSQQFIGTDDFGPDGWSGSGFAAGEELEVGKVFTRIKTGLNQSAPDGVLSLDFNTGAKGIVGGPDDGPLIMDADDQTAGVPAGIGRVRNVGEVDLFIQAGGPLAKIENIHCGNFRARNRLLGTGTFGTASISQGKQTVSSATVVNEYHALGGVSKIAYNATALDFIKITAGEHLLQRKADLIKMSNGILDLDPDPSVTQTGAKIELGGGLVRWWAGELPEIEGDGGILDFRYARGKLGPALGATLFIVTGTKIRATADIDLSNLETLPAILRSELEPIDFSGSPIQI